MACCRVKFVEVCHDFLPQIFCNRPRCSDRDKMKPPTFRNLELTPDPVRFDQFAIDDLVSHDKDGDAGLENQFLPVSREGRLALLRVSDANWKWPQHELFVHATLASRVNLLHGSGDDRSAYAQAKTTRNAQILIDKR